MDRIVETQHGYDVIVDGTRYGTWRSRGEASAGLVTEQIRAKDRAAAETERDMAYIDAETQRHHEWRNRD